jgi:CubicO group peptidase (beta-lactamase class C family)
VVRESHAGPTPGGLFHRGLPIGGFVAPGFEQVGIEFQKNFTQREEQGAACTIFHRGEKVVDLWGGYRCAESRAPWTEETLSLSFSVTKGMAAATMAVAHSRGLFELDENVAAYWPEFSAAGKGEITVRQLLAHQAGLVSVDQRLDAKLLADHDRLSTILSRQPALWVPGTRHGYHTLTLGWYQNELIRRTDPQGRSLGAFFQDEIAVPLGVEFYIGLPDRIAEDRLSRIKGFHRVAMLGRLNQLPIGMVLAGAWPRSLVAKSVRCLKVANPAELGSPELRAVEIPSANGIGRAAAVARVYDVLARGGTELGVKPSTWAELVAPPRQPSQGIRDTILKFETRYGFGFSRPSAGFSFGADGAAFGCPGAGGSFAMADPTEQLGFAYLTNKMGFRLFNDPREQAMRAACYACLASARPKVAIAA